MAGAELVTSTTVASPVKDLINKFNDLPTSLLSHVHDCHCHPTDEYLAQPAVAVSPLRGLRTGILCAMSTRSRDQNLVQYLHELSSDKVIAFYGCHPWFTHLYYLDHEFPPSSKTHYEAILKPVPSEEIIEKLPQPMAFSVFLAEMEERLKNNPDAHIGEIGMDRSFRLPNPGDSKGLSPYRVSIDHQRRVLEAQLRLAGKYGRVVSVHGVQCHGLLFDVFRGLWKEYEQDLKNKQSSREDGDEDDELKHLKATKACFIEDMTVRPYPPRICLHSFSAPPAVIANWIDSRVPFISYFSFSTTINARYEQKWLDTIRAVPDDRVLVESDWNESAGMRESRLEEAVAVVAGSKGWEADDAVRRFEKNFWSWLRGETKKEDEVNLMNVDRVRKTKESLKSSRDDMQDFEE